MDKKSNRIMIITLVAMGLILCLFLIMSISAKDTTYVKPNPLAYTGYIFNSALFGVNTNPLQEPNYLGLAQMGLIPSKIQCSHTKESYISTDVVVTNKQDGIKYLILQSKFGDESCLVKI